MKAESIAANFIDQDGSPIRKRGLAMNRRTEFIEQLKWGWAKYRWLILAVVVFLSASFEFIEFILEPASLSNLRYVLELILQGFVLPILLLTLQRTESQKNRAINTLSLLESFAYQLNNVRDWDELIGGIVQFPRSIVPLAGIALWIRSSNPGNFDLESMQVFQTDFQAAQHPSSLEPGNLQCCRTQAIENRGSTLCICPLQGPFTGSRHNRYCLLLVNENAIIGLIHLYIPATYRLLEDQKIFFDNIAPEISLSINKFLLQRMTKAREEAIEAERHRFASDLHDTLGQDLVFLRNKIDQLIRNYPSGKAPLVKQQLQQMSMVAEEANQTIRNILVATHSEQKTALDARLLVYVKTIGERVNFKISIDSEGPTQDLPPQMQFQIFLIFREILANIEKHAHANHVTVALTWCKEELTMTISDDGRGFQINQVNKNNHFGLTIIEARTREMNGSMSVESAPKRGTKITIWLPIPE